MSRRRINPPRLARGSQRRGERLPDFLCLTFVSRACIAGWKHSIFDAVTGPWNSRRAREHENCNTSHAKTTFLPLYVLKTPSLGARARATHPRWTELWVPGGAPEFAPGAPGAQKVSKKTLKNRSFFYLAFGPAFFASRTRFGAQNGVKIDPKSSKNQYFGGSAVRPRFFYKCVKNALKFHARDT